jgi:amidase
MSSKPTTSQPDHPNRRSFLSVAVTGLATATLTGQVGGNKSHNFSTIAQRQASGDFELLELSIADLQQGMATGKWTSQRLSELYLERIALLDGAGPTLHQILDQNPDASRIAAGLDAERRAGKIRGPLHGIPILLKDNIDTADRMTTTAGSLALEGSRPARDAFLADRLRAAGAVLLAKTNMSEWANFRSSRSSSGWSSRGGQGRNPYALDRTPCGSSSGTGGAVAASFAAAGIGTETDGSITCPASAEALVGLKPTVGVVSRSGIIPISATQDTAGPMGRTVADVAALLGGITGVDPADAATRAAAPLSGVDFLSFLDPDGLKGVRLGVTRKHFTGYHDGTDRLFAAAIDVLRQLGAVIIDPADLPHAGEYDAAEYEVLLHEFKSGLNAYLATLPAGPWPRTLTEMIAFNERERERVMPFFGQETFLAAEARGPLTSPVYRRALAKCRRLSRAEGIDAALTKHRLDALIAPTGNPPWPIDVINGDHFTGSVTTPAAVAGYPHITVPMGFDHGLPVGLSLFGAAWTDGKLLKYAFAYEQATRHRRPPQFLTTAELGDGMAGHRSAGPA